MQWQHIGSVSDADRDDCEGSDDADSIEDVGIFHVNYAPCRVE